MTERYVLRVEMWENRGAMFIRLGELPPDENGVQLLIHDGSDIVSLPHRIQKKALGEFLTQTRDSAIDFSLRRLP